MSTPNIRPFRDSDVSWIIDEHAYAYSAILNLTADEVEEQRRNLRRFLTTQSAAPPDGILPARSELNPSDFPETRVTWVATDSNDGPIGCVSTRVSALQDFEDPTKVGEWTSKTTNLIVHKDHQRKGIARALLRKVEPTLAPDGTEPVIHLSAHDEAEAALALYSSCGYTSDGPPMKIGGRVTHFFKQQG